MQKIDRQLQARRRALPTLKAKETALRVEVQKAQGALENLQLELKKFMNAHSQMTRLWVEYPDLLRIKQTDIQERNIAGVKIPVLRGIDFNITKAALFHQRAWIVAGTNILKEIVELKITIELQKQSMQILYRARKKTTQKVNLYEKVQIPEFQNAIRKIKRFLEDEENLSRASQKIVKRRTSTL